MKSSNILRKLVSVFVLMFVVNVFYEAMRYYTSSEFLMKEIIAKTIIVALTLYLVKVEFEKKK